MSLYEEIRPLLDLSIGTFSIAQLRYVAWQKVFASAAPPPASRTSPEVLLQKAKSALANRLPNSISSHDDGDDSDNKKDEEKTADDDDGGSSSVIQKRTLEILSSLKDGTAHVRDEQQLLLELSKATIASTSEELQSAVRTLLLPKTTTDLLDSFGLYHTDKQFQSFLKRIGGEDFHREVIQSAGINTSLVACNDYHVDTGPIGTELVYLIFRDDTTKRIVVTFRGSITPTDWVHDVRMGMHETDNPFYDTKQQKQREVEEESASPFQQQPKIIRIHKGFHCYLLTAANNSSRDLQKQDEPSSSKFDQILFKVKQQLKEYPNYEVYVTGHSLGGAASTLFAFMYCAEMVTSSEKEESDNDDNKVFTNNNNKPLITVVSFGSPKVGDRNFSHAFGLLQQRQNRLLRNVRVTNEDDIIPAMPVTSIPITPMDGVHRYKHVAGIHLLVQKPLFSKLRNTKPVCCIHADYPRIEGEAEEEDDDEAEEETENSLKQLEVSAERVAEDLSAPIRKTPMNHMLNQYHERLNGIQNDLPDRSLDELYQDYRKK